MSDADKNTETLRKCYERWNDTRGASVSDWMDILADEIDFRSLAMGNHPSAGFTAPLSSRNAVKGYFDGLLDAWEMQHYTVSDYIAQNDKVCVIATTAWTYKTTGKTIETPKVDVWQFEDGKAIAFFEYYDTALLFSAAEQP